MAGTTAVGTAVGGMAAATAPTAAAAAGARELTTWPPFPLPPVFFFIF